MTTVHPPRPPQQRPAGPGARPGQTSTTTPSIDPFRVIRKHMTLLVAAGVFGIIFGVGAFFALAVLHPLYTSSVIFEIKPPVEGTQVVAGDLEDDDVVIRLAKTEMTYVLSRVVLGRAMNDPDIQTTEWSRDFLDSAGNFMVEDAVDELEDALILRYLPDTNLFEVEWSATNRDDVPVVLNKVKEHYLVLRNESEDAKFTKDLDVFTTQENDINRELANLQSEISKYVKQYNVLTLERVREHPLAFEVMGLSQQLAQAKSGLGMLQTSYEQTAAKLTGELEPSAEDRLLAENDRVIISVIAQITNLRINRRALIDEFGENHRSVMDIERRVRVAEDELEDQINKTIQRNLNGQLKNFANQIEMYRQMIEQLNSELMEKDEQLAELASNVSEYESITLRRDNKLLELQQTREMITELQRVRLRAAADRVQPFTDAMTPRERSFPLPEIIIPLGFLLVVGSTLGLIFLREMTDKRVKSASDLAVIPGARVLGVIPDLEEDPTQIHKTELAVRDEPRSVIAESYRQTCTPILKMMDLRGHQSLVVVGGLPGAGTTAFVSNLAAFIAAGGRKLLAIDANFRRPGLAPCMDSADPECPGLGDLLVGQASLDNVIHECGGGIDLITAGTPSNRVFERLNNGEFDVLMADLRTRYDFILVDAPPAVVAGDALVLANRTDASVLVVRANQEQRGLVARLINQFNDAHSELLGIVLNRPRWTAGGYFRKNYATMAEYASKSD